MRFQRLQVSSGCGAGWFYYPIGSGCFWCHFGYIFLGCISSVLGLFCYLGFFLIAGVFYWLSLRIFSFIYWNQNFHISHIMMSRYILNARETQQFHAFLSLSELELILKSKRDWDQLVSVVITSDFLVLVDGGQFVSVVFSVVCDLAFVHAFGFLGEQRMLLRLGNLSSFVLPYINT